MKNKPLNIIAMIPARYDSTRLPGKLMKDLAGKPVIIRTLEATIKTGLFKEVYVVTDSNIIQEEVLKYGGQVMMSKKQHECGSDRIAEAVEFMDVDVVVNVQGDEPFMVEEPLKKLIEVFLNDTEEKIDLASLKQKLLDWEDINNPNVVKVVTDYQGFAMYFSRSPIPFPRDKETGVTYYKHIGVYAFRKRALMDFYSMPMRSLEATEKLENLRYLEYGKKIKLVETDFKGIGIDTAEDLAKAQKYFLA
ncbi:3-deoxy-manno-octulosonate cytidylyltransferase [Namhaeicola litoreus]|uniref:3-deoxy-manno-octulosonate cytidylyltransferase n=1 Tax=Namhaeicola litoreus TaxID=1052145 RepID=A0ABW3Y2U9_9FLAO